MNASGAVARVVGALERCGCEPRQHGRGWRARCPAHEDRSPSLSLDEGNDGRALIICRAGCTLESIVDRLGLTESDLFEPRDYERRASVNPGKVYSFSPKRGYVRPESLEEDIARWMESLSADENLYAFLREKRGLSDEAILEAKLGHDGERYTIPVFDRDRHPLFVKRYLPGGKPKFLQLRGVTAQLFGVETLSDLADGALVLVVGGELDALRCRSLGYNAVAGTGGEGCWREEWSTALSRFEVVVALDADQAGARGTDGAVASLRNAGSRAGAFVWPADTPLKTDVTDYTVKLGHPREEFAALVDEARRTSAGASKVEVSVSESEDLEDEGEIPELPQACWRRGFEEFREAQERCSEGSVAFLFGGYLVVAGLVLGRQAMLRSGLTVFPNIYLTNVGASGRSRKTSRQDIARRMLDRVVGATVEVSDGIGSPEGLLDLLAGRTEDGADYGKPHRVVINVGETATLLRKGNQEATRGLIPFLTQIYDCPPSARLPNRTKPVLAIQPFLSIMGSSTAEWLRSSLALDDIRGGLAGRFLYMVGREGEPIPFPPEADDDAQRAAERALDITGRFHAEALKRYDLSPKSKELWSNWYIAERRREYPSPLLECLSQRLHLHAWKLALVYAALERTDEITEEQLAAACAFADYQRAAQAYVFMGFGDSERVKTERRIVEVLEKSGPLAGWEIQQRVRRVSAEYLTRAITALGRLGVIEERQTGRGRKWHLAGGRD